MCVRLTLAVSGQSELNMSNSERIALSLGFQNTKIK